MSIPHATVDGPEQTGATPPPQVRVVDYCQGSTWALSRATGVVWVLSGPPSVVAERVAAALARYRPTGSTAAG